MPRQPVTQVSQKQITSRAAMQVLGDLLRASWHPDLAKARPIVFDFVTEQWSFDPAHPKFPVREGRINNAALSIRCTPEALYRVLVEKGFEPRRYDMIPEGDIDALTPLIRALESGQSALSLRASAQKNRSES